MKMQHLYHLSFERSVHLLSRDAGLPSEDTMPHHIMPLPFKPPRLDGLSERLLASHYENNYGGAVRRLNAIEQRLSGLDWGGAPSFEINGLARERLIAANSM